MQFWIFLNKNIIYILIKKKKFFDRVFLNKKTKQNKIKNFLKIMVSDDI
jgi:hypothetical protein